MKHVNYLIGVIVWLFGLVLAHGWLSTTVAALFPLYAWYLAAEWAVARL